MRPNLNDFFPGFGVACHQRLAKKSIETLSGITPEIEDEILFSSRQREFSSF